VNKLCEELTALMSELEAIALTPNEQVILYDQVNDIEDRIASLQRLLTSMVRPRLRLEERARMHAAIDALNVVKNYLSKAQTLDRTDEERARFAALLERAHELQEEIMEASGERMSRNPPEPT
jgi:DNA repair exonuclease SbcCD ATPase subunit